MRILHLSDPHLVAADQGLVRGRPALAHFERALQLGGALNPDLVLVTGDLCQDESWGGYARLRRALSQHVRCSVALLPGNHDHPLLLDAVLGRRWTTAPADLLVQGVRVLLLSSHRVGSAAGALGSLQLQWLAQRLQCSERRDLPLVVALHHPPIAIGDAGMDAIRLLDQAVLRSCCVPIGPCGRCCLDTSISIGRGPGPRGLTCCCSDAPPRSAVSKRCSPAPGSRR